MTKDETLSELNKLFHEIFEDYDIILSEETTAKDIKDWDSLSHIRMITEVEAHFSIAFSTPEIMRWRNVGMMADSIKDKLDKK